MRIKAARISAKPDHALTRRDVRGLLDAVPDEWRAEVAEVHLLADLPPKMWASSEYLDWVGVAHAGLHRSTNVRGARRHALTGEPGILRIRCRGASKDDAARAALHALATGCGLLGPQKRFPFGLTRPERRKLDQLIEPFLRRFLATVRPPVRP